MAKPHAHLLVLNNGDLNPVTWKQRVMVGDAKFEASQDLPNLPYARYAESLGLLGIRLDKPEDIGAAWDEALSANRPCLIEAIVDPEVPPLPPHITFDQAAKFWKSMFKGDVHRWHMLKQSFKDMVENFIPH